MTIYSLLTGMGILCLTIYHSDSLQEIGASTPEAFFREAAEIKKSGTFTDFSRFYKPTDEFQKKEVDAIVGLMWEAQRARALLKLGKEKWGDDFEYVIDAGSYELGLCLDHDINFSIALSGEIKTSKMLDEIIATGTVSIIDVYGDEVMMSYPLIQKDGRWFIEIPDKRQILLEAVKGYLDELEILLNATKVLSEMEERIAGLSHHFEDYY